MPRSVKVKQYLKPKSGKVPDDFGVFGRRFRVPEPLGEKQVLSIPEVKNA